MFALVLLATTQVVAARPARVSAMQQSWPGKQESPLDSLKLFGQYVNRSIHIYVCVCMKSIFTYVYVCMHVCMYVCMYVCTYVRMYVCT